MSVISFPRRIDTRRSPSGPAVRPTHRQSAPRRAEAAQRWRSTSSARKAAVVFIVALAICLAGSMFEANRQIQIHQLQSELLQQQSTYA
jgi:hypothetical protein